MTGQGEAAIKIATIPDLHGKLAGAQEFADKLWKLVERIPAQQSLPEPANESPELLRAAMQLRQVLAGLEKGYKLFDKQKGHL